MTFFSNPNRGIYPSPYEQYGRPNPFRRQQDYNTSPYPYGNLGPVNRNSRWGPINPSNWQQQPSFNPYDRQQQPSFNPYDRQQQPFLNPYDRQQQQFFDPYDRQQQSIGRPSLMDGLNTIMGHAGTVTNGVNMMRQIGSILGFLR